MNKTSRKAAPAYQGKIWAQILIPIILFTLLAIAALVLAVVFTKSNPVETEHLASVSTIIIILPWLFLGLVPLALLILLSWLAGKGIRVLPIWLQKSQAFIYNLFVKIYQVDRSVTKPVIAVKSKAAAVDRFLSFLRR